MSDKRSRSKSEAIDDALANTPGSAAGPLADTPGTEDDGGESAMVGRSREHHPGVPDEVESLQRPPAERPPGKTSPAEPPQSDPQQNSIDESLEETFPASDPPSYMGGTRQE